MCPQWSVVILFLNTWLAPCERPFTLQEREEPPNRAREEFAVFLCFHRPYMMTPRVCFTSSITSIFPRGINHSAVCQWLRLPVNLHTGMSGSYSMDARFLLWSTSIHCKEEVKLIRVHLERGLTVPSGPDRTRVFNQPLTTQTDLRPALQTDDMFNTEHVMDTNRWESMSSHSTRITSDS